MMHVTLHALKRVWKEMAEK